MASVEAGHFLDSLVGAHVCVTLCVVEPHGPKAYRGILREVYPDHLVLRLAAGDALLIFNHAIATVGRVQGH